MSLLLEALKKAEKAKDESPAPATGGLELSLTQEPRASERSLAHGDADPEQFASADSRSAERRAADQLFTAKSPPSKRVLAVVGAVLLSGPVLGFGLTGVWAANGLYRLGQALYCAHAWRSRRWVGIKI